MFPITFETIDNIPDSAIDPVGVEMQELTDAINAIGANIPVDLVKYMYGKMEIHDNVMDIYDTDGNIIRTFSLFDQDGNPTTSNPVYKREIQA